MSRKQTSPGIIIRPPGEWRLRYDNEYKGGGFYQCSKCGYCFAFGAYLNADEEFRYCPHCGSLMETLNGETGQWAKLSPPL